MISPKPAVSSFAYNGHTTLLATATADILDSQGNRVTVRALCDSGSQITFITEHCMQQLKLKRQKFDMNIAGAGDVPGPCTRGMAKLQMKSRHEIDFSLQVDAFVLAKITAELPSRRIKMNEWNHLRGLKLSDPNFGTPGNIDLLIGVDVWSSIIRDGLINGKANEPHAQNTHLGWVVSGPVDLIHCYMAHSMHIQGNQDLERALTRFWELEEPNVSEAGAETIDECEQHFSNTVKRKDDGRYVVDIPFLEGEPKLGNSRRMATQQFFRNERRMHSDPDLLEKYIAFMQEYEQLGHMALYEGDVSENADAYYIPHHAVTAKFRVVFNASAKSSNGVSLNDTQHIGPTVQERLADILLRFRRYAVVVVADVEKMFRQVEVNINQQKWQLVLWREDPNMPLRTYRLTTVTYGTRSGPYLAVRSLIQCGRDNCTIIRNTEHGKEALQSIEKDFYVDDYLTSSPSAKAAIRLAKNVDQILQQGQMHLRKWQSNNDIVLRAIADENGPGKYPLPINPTEASSVLGLRWDGVTDTLSFEITLEEAMTNTKRTILSDVSKLYDPTGLLAPVVIVAKMYMQKLHLAGVTWDEQIAPEILREWCTYRQSLFELAGLEIPRHVGMAPDYWTTLHGFCDASSRAYAAVIYVRTVDFNGKVTVRLLTSKTRVAPIKTVSIPRLELCGAQLLVTTINTVREAMALKDVEYFLWTDSTIVLGWLRQLPIRYKPYVANRVSHIQQHSELASWHHIPTAQNPADCASRGISVAKFLDHPLWWTGPEFLQRGNQYTHENEPVCTADEQQIIRKEEKAPEVFHHRMAQSFAITTWQRDGRRINIFDRTNSLLKLRRIMARILNCVRKNRFKSEAEIYSVERLEEATILLTKLDQMQWFKKDIAICHQMKELPNDSVLLKLHPFIDDKGILRLGGRLKRANIDTNQKYPIILAKRSRLAYMIVADAHQRTLHGNVEEMLQCIRQTYWIIGGRSIVKTFIGKCVSCRLQRGTVAKQRMGDLPAHRVNRHRPFSVSGIDYGGPFTLRLGPKRSRTTTKTYVAIFVCMVTKAVHIELATDLSTEAFLNAFARFTSRRGPCEHLYSDNATNFHGANNRMRTDLEEWHTEHVQQQLAHQGTQWHFIPPAAPHQGGIWEAAVKSAERHIYRVVGNCTMAYEQFYTLLTRVEACLNSRPLVALHDDPEGRMVLTPGDFLTGGPIVATPEPSLMNLPTNRIKEWQLVQRWTEEIWQRWVKEYLHTLQQRNKWRKAEENIKVNDVVAIMQENLPPTQWCIGRVSEVHKGEDGLVRVVTTQHYDKATGRTFSKQRPIQKVCVLVDKDDSETNVPEEAGNVTE